MSAFLTACDACGAGPNRICLALDGRCIHEHRIFESQIEAGNAGAATPAWSASCRCGWTLPTYHQDRERFEALVLEHLA